MIDLEAELVEQWQETATLVRRLGGSVTPRELARHLWRFRRPSAAAALLATMERRGLGRWERRRPGPRGGRPTNVFVLLDGEAPPEDEAKLAGTADDSVGAVGAQKD